METNGYKVRIQTSLFGIAKRVRRNVEARLGSSGRGVTTLQFAVMCHLQSGSQTINELARRMMIKPPSLIACVDALERAGYLRRVADPTDRRRTPLRITPKGESLLKEMPVCAESDALSVA